MFEFRFFSGAASHIHRGNAANHTFSLRALATTCALALTLAFTAPASAQPDSSRLTSFDIPSQALPAALSEYARQSGLEMLYSPEIVAGRTSTTVDGDMTRPDALRQLLQGTGLEFEQTPSGGMMVGDEAALAAYRAELAANNASAGQNTIGQRRPGIEEIIVTGQKREERIQDVPIAISAFSPEDLEAQKIEGGFDLLKGVPNVTFSKTNFTGYNFQIRGIGTQAISATTDPGVAVSFNNTTLIVNRLFEQEYLDVERVEVLRGPQGTLFGRNATGGVINVISKKPELGVWDGMIDIEVGNYNTRRLRGFFNAPIGDTLAVRGAYASTVRDGYGTNLAASEPFADVSSDVDGRDLWTGRLSLGWQPNDRFRANLIWERFEEDDNRVRTSKQLCHRDDTPAGVGGVPFDDELGDFEIVNATYSQGCEAGSLYADEAFGTTNGASLPYVSGIFYSQTYGGLAGSFLRGNILENFGTGPNRFEPSLPLFAGMTDDPSEAPCPGVASPPSVWTTYAVDLCQPDPYGGRTQSRDLREIYSLIEPEYRAEADIVEFSFDYDWTDSLTLSSQSVYVKDEYYATQDFNRFTTVPIWNGEGAANACGGFLFLGIIPAADCSNNPDTGRGTFLPLTDDNGDGAIDQLNESVGSYTVDGGGFLRDGDGNRVGYYNHILNNGAPNTFCDPQLGCSDKLVAQDLARAKSTQYNQEIRLVSSFEGPWNFSLGANYTKFRTEVDYFVFSNAFSLLMQLWPFNGPASLCPAFGGPSAGVDVSNANSLYEVGDLCRYMDPNPLSEIDGEGHNYFRSANPYELTSSAVFGELYWNAAETVKVTLGLRMNWDQKVFTPRPSQLLLADYRDLQNVVPGDPPPGVSLCRSDTPDCPFTGTAENGRGSPSLPNIVQSWREPTGRLVVDWQPVLGFTDETMVYVSFAHGYKGGGANPPGVAPPSGAILAAASAAVAPKTFEPEYINAYEIGTKNTLFGGALVLNGTVFYYDYTDYQVSKIVDRSAVNENFDAENLGAELEIVFAPSLDWQFNAAIGWLQTEIAEGEKSIDLMDRAQGGNQSFTGGNGHTYDSWEVIKPWVTAASNCIVPTELLAANVAGSGRGIGQFDFNYCPAGGLLDAAFPIEVEFFDEDGNLANGRLYDPAVDAPNGGAGFFADLGGNELPNAPHFTVALGGQYNFDLTRDWRATARVDYYWQDKSFARVYNTEYDRLKSWSNTNLSFWIVNENSGITVEGYVKNVFDETPITGTFLNSDDTGLTTNVFTLDPRLIGVSIRKEF